MSVNMIVQTKCKFSNKLLFPKLLYIQSKEIWNKKYYEENIWQSEILPEYRH